MSYPAWSAVSETLAEMFAGMDVRHKQRELVERVICNEAIYNKVKKVASDYQLRKEIAKAEYVKSVRQAMDAHAEALAAIRREMQENAE